jgi:hypothetical protein
VSLLSSQHNTIQSNPIQLLLLFCVLFQHFRLFFFFRVSIMKKNNWMTHSRLLVTADSSRSTRTHSLSHVECRRNEVLVNPPPFIFPPFLLRKNLSGVIAICGDLWRVEVKEQWVCGR